MTEPDKAGLEAARLAIAKCKAVGRTTVEDHAYEAVTAYLEATQGGEDAPLLDEFGISYHMQATGDDWETPCPDREDKQHCNCWYDGDKCCSCGDAASPEQPAPQDTDDDLVG